MYENIKVQFLLFETTSFCNLNCKHCFNRNDIGNHMSVEKMRDAIERALHYGLNQVDISGGEPLLHPDFPKILSLCDQFPQVEFTLTTNGLLLDQNLIALFEQKNNLSVQISMDGSNAECYEHLRGPNTFVNFLQAFELFRKSNIKKKITRMCVTSKNYRDVENVYRISYDNHIVPTFIFIYGMGNALVNWETLEPTLSQKLYVIDKINKLNHETGLQLKPPEPTRTCTITDGEERRGLIVKPDGAAVLCQFFYDLDIGNVFENSYEDIFHHRNVFEIYETAAKRNEMLTKSVKCKECMTRDACRFGCIGMANDEGNILGFDGECELREAISLCYVNKLITPPIEKGLKYV